MIKQSAFPKESHRKFYKRKVKKIKFEYSDHNAKKVLLVGDFNSWRKRGIPMLKKDNDLWQTEVMLCSGIYEYKYIVDGEWKADPMNDQYVENSFGSRNSLRKVDI